VYACAHIWDTWLAHLPVCPMHAGALQGKELRLLLLLLLLLLLCHEQGALACSSSPNEMTATQAAFAWLRLRLLLLLLLLLVWEGLAEVWVRQACMNNSHSPGQT